MSLLNTVKLAMKDEKMRMALIKPQGTYSNWYRRPVLGLSYISSLLRKNGYENRIFDAYFKTWSEEELIKAIIDYQPDIIGFSSMTHEIITAAQIAKRIKELISVPVIIGGCHVTALPEATMSEFPVFDIAVYGEGEKTALELLDYYKSGNRDLNQIKGIFSAKTGA